MEFFNGILQKILPECGFSVSHDDDDDKLVLWVENESGDARKYETENPHKYFEDTSESDGMEVSADWINEKFVISSETLRDALTFFFAIDDETEKKNLLRKVIKLNGWCKQQVKTHVNSMNLGSKQQNFQNVIGAMSPETSSA